MKTHPRKNVDTYIRSSIVPNSQDMETTRCPSSDEEIYKRWSTHATERQFTLKKEESKKKKIRKKKKKEESTDTHYNVDEL